MAQKKYGRKEKGQGLVEYALILVLVSIVVIVVLAVLGPSVGNIFSNITESLGGDLSGGGSSNPYCDGYSGYYMTFTDQPGFVFHPGDEATYNAYLSNPNLDEHGLCP